jgi:hypothetical protein
VEEVTLLTCCLGGWRRLVCIADNLQHAIPGPVWFPALCNWHDRLICEVPGIDLDTTSHMIDGGINRG